MSQTLLRWIVISYCLVAAASIDAKASHCQWETSWGITLCPIYNKDLVIVDYINQNPCQIFVCYDVLTRDVADLREQRAPQEATTIIYSTTSTSTQQIRHFSQSGREQPAPFEIAVANTPSWIALAILLFFLLIFLLAGAYLIVTCIVKRQRSQIESAENEETERKHCWRRPRNEPNRYLDVSCIYRRREDTVSISSTFDGNETRTTSITTRAHRHNTSHPDFQIPLTPLPARRYFESCKHYGPTATAATAVVTPPVPDTFLTGLDFSTFARNLAASRRTGRSCSLPLLNSNSLHLAAGASAAYEPYDPLTRSEMKRDWEVWHELEKDLIMRQRELNQPKGAQREQHQRLLQPRNLTSTRPGAGGIEDNGDEQQPSDLSCYLDDLAINGEAAKEKDLSKEQHGASATVSHSSNPPHRSFPRFEEQPYFGATCTSSPKTAQRNGQQQTPQRRLLSEKHLQRVRDWKQRSTEKRDDLEHRQQQLHVQQHHRGATSTFCPSAATATSRSLASGSAAADGSAADGAEAAAVGPAAAKVYSISYAQCHQQKQQGEKTKKESARERQKPDRLEYFENFQQRSSRNK